MEWNTCVRRVYYEVIELVRHAPVQSLSVDPYFTRIAYFIPRYVNLEWRAGDVLSVLVHIDQMDTRLVRSE